MGEKRRSPHQILPPLAAVSTVLFAMRVLTIQLPMVNRQCP